LRARIVYSISHVKLQGPHEPLLLLAFEASTSRNYCEINWGGNLEFCGSRAIMNYLLLCETNTPA